MFSNKWCVFALALAMLLGLGGLSQAETILLVSDAYPPGDPAVDHEDDTLVRWLTGLGYNVDTHGMGTSMQGVFDAADQAAIDGADLIMVSRRTNSGAYNQPAQWNGIQKPLILMSGYLTRSSRWGWTSGGSGNVASTETDMDVKLPAHQFVTQIHAIPDPVQLFDWSTAPTPGQAPKGIYIPPSADVLAGTELVGTMDTEPERAMLFDIPVGTDLGDNYGGETVANRAFFGHWGYDFTLGAPINRRAQWDDFITQDYKDVLENMIAYKIPEPGVLTMLVMGLLAAAFYGWRRRS